MLLLHEPSEAEVSSGPTIAAQISIIDLATPITGGLILRSVEMFYRLPIHRLPIPAGNPYRKPGGIRWRFLFLGALLGLQQPPVASSISLPLQIVLGLRVGFRMIREEPCSVVHALAPTHSSACGGISAVISVAAEAGADAVIATFPPLHPPGSRAL